MIKGIAILKGMILGNTIEYSIPFQIPKPSQEELGPLTMPIVHHLAAKSLLKVWEAGEGVKQLKVPAKEAIIKLSIDSSVVSAHTAYVAVDEDQDKPIEGAIQIWDVTTMMAQQEMGGFYGMHVNRECSRARKGIVSYGHGSRVGFTSMQQLSAFSNIMMSGPPRYYPGPSYPEPCVLPVSKRACIPSYNFGPRMIRSLPLPSSSYAPPQACNIALPVLNLASDCRIPMEYSKECGHDSTSVKTHSDKLSALVSLQQAEGWWKLDATLAVVLSKSLPELEVACPVVFQGDVRQVWATVLALVYLEACLTGQRQEWELVAMKAEFWLGGQNLPAGSTLHALKVAARNCL